MAEIIANWLLGHCPALVRALSSLTPLQVLLLTAAICAALAIGSGREISLSARQIKRREVRNERRVQEFKAFLRDDDIYDADWMDYDLWLHSK